MQQRFGEVSNTERADNDAAGDVADDDNSSLHVNGN